MSFPLTVSIAGLFYHPIHYVNAAIYFLRGNLKEAGKSAFIGVTQKYLTLFFKELAAIGYDGSTVGMTSDDVVKDLYFRYLAEGRSAELLAEIGPLTEEMINSMRYSMTGLGIAEGIFYKDLTITVEVVDSEGNVIGTVTSGENATGHGYSVDSTMFSDDEAAGVLRNGEYVKNPTAHNINDYISEGSNYLGSKNMNGQYMYVVDMEGNIIIGTRVGQRMPHPTLVGGINPQVQVAGIVEIRGGKIYSINNASGHFKPGVESLKIAKEAFSKLPNIIFSNDFQGYLPYGG